MSRLPALNPETATGQAQQLLQGVQKKLGFAPNIMRTMANSPAVLQGYLDFSGALSKGNLSPKFREQIALTVSEVNNCDYCLAAHSAIGRMVGLSEEAIGDSRRGESTDTKEATGLAFTRSVVMNRGWVTDEEVAKLRKAGFADGEIAEILANIGLTLFTNYFNHVAGTEVDFPEVAPVGGRTPSACACS
jgi:uncharacterized peroxidase-related enzyme